MSRILDIPEAFREALPLTLAQEEAMAITRDQCDLLTRGMTIVSTIRQAKSKRLCWVRHSGDNTEKFS